MRPAGRERRPRSPLSEEMGGIVSLTRLFGEIWQSRDLDADLEALCDCGGRFAGTPSERLAREWLRGRLAEAAGAPIRSHAFRFNGWVREHSSVMLMGGPSPQLLPSTSLV